MTGARISEFGEEPIAFGRYRLFRMRRLLTRDDEVVALGSREIEILIALAERAGETVAKADLMERVWPDTYVEEANLRVQMAGLRRALLDDQGEPTYLHTVAGRGYRFVGEIEGPRLAPGSGPFPRNDLPRAVSRLIGRDTEVSALSEDLTRWRLVSIVGLGGVGKTRVAVAVAERVRSRFKDGVCYIDLISISDPVLVPSALAAALGAAVQIDDPIPTLVAKLMGRQVLLVFDNCEHVALAVTQLVEAILRQVPEVRILATTREPLRAEGERIRRLTPLSVPDRPVASAKEALDYPAVQLFLERANARTGEFSDVQDAEAQVIAEICRKLDGLALAIELAAGQVDSLGLRELNHLLGERFLSIGGGQRTAENRHQTLAAAMDWSYGLLPSEEQSLLARLGVFAGRFDLAAATFAAGHSGFSADGILRGILSLAAKSLVVVEKPADGSTTQYRLLETTRAYALHQLKARGDEQETRRRHARHCLQLSNRSETEWDSLDRRIWLDIYSRVIGDIRTAIDWAMSDAGDVELGLELILASAPLGVQLSLVDEYRLRVEVGLERIIAEGLGPMLELQFTTALGHLTQQLRGPVPMVLAAFDRCVELATQLDVPKLKADAYRGMWVSAFGSANYPLAVEYARRQATFAEVAGHRGALLQARRMLSQAHHYHGDFDDALALAEEVMRDRLSHIPLRENFPLQVDRRVSLKIIMARIQWIRGDEEAAAVTVEECLELAAADHAIALCHALALAACPIAFWNGDFNRVAELSDQLIDHAGRSASSHWQSWGQLYRDALTCKLEGVPQPTEWAALVSYPKKLDMLATLDPAFATEAVQQRVEDGLVGWCAAEVLRARAVQSAEAGKTAKAAALLERAGSVAREQLARNWERRIAATTRRLG